MTNRMSIVMFVVFLAFINGIAMAQPPQIPQRPKNLDDLLKARTAVRAKGVTWSSAVTVSSASAQDSLPVLEKHRDLYVDLLKPKMKTNIKGETPIQPGENLLLARITSCRNCVGVAFSFRAEPGRSYKVYWRGVHADGRPAGPLLNRWTYERERQIMKAWLRGTWRPIVWDRTKKEEIAIESFECPALPCEPPTTQIDSRANRVYSEPVSYLVHSRANNRLLARARSAERVSIDHKQEAP